MSAWPATPDQRARVTRVTSHDFDHLYPAVRTGGCARALNDLSDVPQCRVEAERVISALERLCRSSWEYRPPVRLASDKRAATPNVSSPPQATQSIELQFFDIAITSSDRSRRSPSALAVLKGLVRDEPRLVPPSRSQAPHRRTIKPYRHPMADLAS